METTRQHSRGKISGQDAHARVHAGSLLFVIGAIALIGAVAWSFFGTGRHTEIGSEYAEYAAEMGTEPLLPLPPAPPADRLKLALGERLFHDPRLSRDEQVSCAFCHPLDKGGADGLAHSVGTQGRRGEWNAPTVFNTVLNFRQSWTGKMESLEEQVDAPLHDPNEMDLDWPVALARLNADESYAAQFADIYADGIQIHNVKDALATFERSLVSSGSRFDRFLRGEPDALDDNEATGYQLFKSYGCAACHQGANVGGNLFTKFGIMRDYLGERGNLTRADMGRFSVTGREEDRHVFKVPSLRMAALTPPYFHDGSVATLEDAIRTMGEVQLGLPLPDQHVDLIAAFIRTLPGEYRGVPR